MSSGRPAPVERRRPPRTVLVRRWAAVLTALALLLLLVYETAGGSSSTTINAAGRPKGTTSTRRQASTRPQAFSSPTGLSGMPPILDPHDIYSADRPGDLSPVVRRYPSLVYVPNSVSNTVDVIDPSTMKIVEHFAVGAEPQHVVPSWDLQTLYVASDQGNTLTPINPATGKPSAPIPVEDPYNMYFTPDGRYAVIVAEAHQRLDFRDAHTMALVHSLPVPCAGVDHMDFSADGTYLIASCEFGAKMIKVNVTSQSVVGSLPLQPGSKPQDVKLSPDGRVFYVADMTSNGVWEIDGNSLQVIGFLPTGRGAHGLYVSRDSRYMYVSNRDEGSVSLVDLASRTVVTKWVIPGGGSPDMGGVSADGHVLWLSGRYSSVVYAMSTVDGHLIAKIPVGRGPHGLCVYPQPGRYSLGHTGVFR
jgi:YVTN family beta-propeller protein